VRRGSGSIARPRRRSLLNGVLRQRDVAHPRAHGSDEPNVGLTVELPKLVQARNSKPAAAHVDVDLNVDVDVNAREAGRAERLTS